ncbi:MAG: hypothetical protein IJF75_00615 [Clostridia bacterium]|nr:hypothetical protein [Clostridia bacterium]
MANIFKDKKFTSLMSVTLALIIVVICSIVIIKERKLAPYNTSTPFLINRWANENDFIIDGSTLISFNPKITLRPKYNIKNLQILIRYLDANGNVVYSSSTQTFGDVSAGGEYELKITLLDIGSLLFSKVEDARIDVVSGTVFRLQRKVNYLQQ